MFLKKRIASLEARVEELERQMKIVGRHITKETIDKEEKRKREHSQVIKRIEAIKNLCQICERRAQWKIITDIIDLHGKQTPKRILQYACDEHLEVVTNYNQINKLTKDE